MPAVAEDRPPSTQWLPNKDEQEDLAAINTMLARMKKVTAPDPYVLTIPQDVEPRYRHSHPQQAHAWLSNTPFQRGEHESLQYQTFFFHEHGKDMYVLHNSRPEEHLAIGGGGRTRPGTGASTPSGGPKKKITLDAYKRGKAGKMATPEGDSVKAAATDATAKQGAVKGPMERIKAETEEMLAVVAETELEIPPAKKGGTQLAESNELKRKRQDLGSEKAPENTAKINRITNSQDMEVNGHSTEPPNKKPKTMDQLFVKDKTTVTAPRQVEQTSQASDKAAKGSLDEERGMPPRLSPGMPPRLSPGMPARLSPLPTDKSSQTLEPPELSEVQALPRRLSPTIPDNIARTLEAREKHRSESRGPHLFAPGSASKDRDGKLTPLKKSDGPLKHKSPIPRNGFRANSSSPAVRSDAEDRGWRQATTVPRPRTPETSHGEELAVGKSLNPSEPRQPGKHALIVKIKVKKARREALKWILKMPPQPDRSSLPTESVPPSSVAGKAPAKNTERRNGERNDTGPQRGVAQKIGPVKNDKKALPKAEDRQPIAEKRAILEDGEISPPSKRKKVEVPEPPKEPSTPAQPELDSPFVPKSGLQATPGTRKDLLSVAMRREQSQDSPLTHNTPPALPSTPSVNGQSTGLEKAPSSQPSTKTLRQQAWETEQKRLEALGRELKHAASAHLNASQATSSGPSEDRKLAAAKATESLLSFLLAFTCADEAALVANPKQAPSYRTWRSLHGFYGVVKRHTEVFPPLYGLVCSLGVAFTSRVMEIATQFPAEGPGREILLETQAFLQKAASEADAKLDLDALQEAFPKAWSQRARKLQQSDKLEPTKLGGQFKLPLGLTTSPVRAARAAHVMLQEWIEREEIEYSLKLKL